MTNDANSQLSTSRPKLFEKFVRAVTFEPVGEGLSSTDWFELFL